MCQHGNREGVGCVNMGAGKVWDVLTWEQGRCGCVNVRAGKV